MKVDEIKKSVVVGAGTMGHSIGLEYARAGIEVVLNARHSESLEKAKKQIHNTLKTLATLGAIQPDDIDTIAARIQYTTDLHSVAGDADIITEAIAENPDAKKALMTDLDKVMKPEAIFASNTSSLNAFELAQEVIPSRMSKVIIHHYFLPAHLIPVVEVVRGEQTSQETIDTSMALMNKLGHHPVLINKFCQSFIVNSIQNGIFAVVYRLLAEGIATPEAIDEAIKYSLGIRLPVVGVVQTLDFTGLDVVADINKSWNIDHQEVIRDIVDKGNFGAKSGKGLYDYQGVSLDDLEAKRDQRYWQVLQSLKKIDAFKPI
jgi:3-hydroxybutyryl-CoA dehydrogenase